MIEDKQSRLGFFLFIFLLSFHTFLLFFTIKNNTQHTTHSHKHKYKHRFKKQETTVKEEGNDEMETEMG